jgi:hypothetical protein
MFEEDVGKFEPTEGHSNPLKIEPFLALMLLFFG